MLIGSRRHAGEEVEDPLLVIGTEAFQAIGEGVGILEGIQNLAGEGLAVMVPGEGFLDGVDEAWELAVKVFLVLVD